MSHRHHSKSTYPRNNDGYNNNNNNNYDNEDNNGCPHHSHHHDNNHYSRNNNKNNDRQDDYPPLRKNHQGNGLNRPPPLVYPSSHQPSRSEERLPPRINYVFNMKNRNDDYFGHFILTCVPDGTIIREHERTDLLEGLQILIPDLGSIEQHKNKLTGELKAQENSVYVPWSLFIQDEHHEDQDMIEGNGCADCAACDS